MNTGIKILIFPSIGNYKSIQLATTANELYIDISYTRIHESDFTSIAFLRNVTLQNPTKTELSLTQTYVKFYVGDKFITQTAVSNSVVKTATLEDLLFNTFGFKSAEVLASEFDDFFKTITNKSKSNHQASKNAENKEISHDVLLYRRVTTIALHLLLTLLCIKKGACYSNLGGTDSKTPTNTHNM